MDLKVSDDLMREIADLRMRVPQGYPSHLELVNNIRAMGG